MLCNIIRVAAFQLRMRTGFAKSTKLGPNSWSPDTIKITRLQAFLQSASNFNSCCFQPNAELPYQVFTCHSANQANTEAANQRAASLLSVSSTINPVCPLQMALGLLSQPPPCLLLRAPQSQCKSNKGLFLKACFLSISSLPTKALLPCFVFKPAIT